jgi:hypothetical protein
LASLLNSISRGAHAGEGVGHEGDEGPVTLSDKDSGVDAIQQLASLFPESVLPFLTEYFGSRTDAAGFISMACPTTTQSNSARMAARCCFYCRLRCRDEAVLNMSGDVHGSDGRKIVDDAHLTPARKLRDRMVVRLARIPVSDVDGEEFPEPFRRPRSKNQRFRGGIRTTSFFPKTESSDFFDAAAQSSTEVFVYSLMATPTPEPGARRV